MVAKVLQIGQNCRPKINLTLKIYQIYQITKIKMSTKSHTKNELARISAKIQQLKRKYPTSSELYAPTDKQNIIVKSSLVDESQNQNINFQTMGRNSLKQRQHYHNSRNSPKKDLNQNTDRSSKLQQAAHTEFNPNCQFYEERKYHQSCSKKAVYNKQNMSPFTQDLNYQKPFKEYKQELKNLKKQILSSLDFQNFQLSKQKAQNTPKIVNNSFDTFSKNQKFNSLNNFFVSNEARQRQTIETKDRETPIQALEKNKHLAIKIVEESQNSMVTEAQLSSNHPIHQYETTKNDEQHLSLQYLNKIVQKLQENFDSHKQQTLEKFERIGSQFQGTLKQNSQLFLKIQAIEKQIKTKQVSKVLSEFDMRMVQMQNQSIGKLSKQLHKEIEVINAEINTIKTQILQREQQSSESESISFSKEIIDAFSQNLRDQIMEKVRLIDQKYENELKEFQGKFFRQIFDMKNDLELMSQKIKKQDYFQKTLKSLIPQTSKINQNQISKEQLLQQIKIDLINDESFLSSIKPSIQQNIQSDLSKKFEDLISKSRFEMIDQMSKEVSMVNKTFKEIQTKMISYGILIENLQEGLKQLSNTQNDDQLEVELIGKIKEAVLSEINSQLESKQFTLKESIIKQRDSKAFLKPQNNFSSNNEENEQSLTSQVLIYPIVNQRNNKSNDASQVSIFNADEGNSDMWLTSLDNQQNKKMFNSEVRYYERPSYTTLEKGQSSFLLDQLVKNSLVFSALNN